MKSPIAVTLESLHGIARIGVQGLGERWRWTLQGLCGLALLELRIYEFTMDRAWLRKAQTSVAEAISLYQTAHIATLGLHGGLAGLGWVASIVNAHLPREGRFDLSDVDDAMLEYVRSISDWDGNVDLIDGATGVAVYASSRGDAPSQRASMLGGYIDMVSESAVWTGKEARWISPSASAAASAVDLPPEGRVNAGLAHGVPGVLSMLARLRIDGNTSLPVERLLTGAMRSCISDISPGGQQVGRAHVGYNLGDGRQARCAWCYGEPGYAAAMASAASAMRRADVMKAGVDLFLTSLFRQDDASRHLYDSGVCHGWSGVALVARHLRRMLVDEHTELSHALALSNAKNNENISLSLESNGVPTFFPHGPEAPVQDATFLTGFVGLVHTYLDENIASFRGSIPWRDAILL